MSLDVKILRDYAGAVVVAVVFALLIRFFVVEAYRIPSASMRPALEPGDTIFVAKWPFGLRLPGQDKPFTKAALPERGDIVVFSPPNQVQQRDFIKRVIGLPGDTVEISGGHVILNGKLLAKIERKNAICEIEALPGTGAGKNFEACTEPPVMTGMPVETVPAGSVFVLGDMRTQNSESKRDVSWGLVPMSALKGKALLIWLSIEPGSRHGSWFSRIRFERMIQRVI